MIRTWWKLASLALAVALAVPSLVGQAKLTPAELTLKKSLGSPSAPIKLEIFSDYQCPACREMHLNTTRQVIDNYVSSGKVYLVHRDFPLAMHPYSRVAARWLNAAAAAGAFQAAETALYTKQDQWGSERQRRADPGQRASRRRNEQSPRHGALAARPARRRRAVRREPG